MITQTVTVTEKNAPNIIIGRRGTYNTEEIVFDLTYLVETFGAGSAVLMVKRPMDNTAYPAVTEQDGNTLTWAVSDIDTNFKGHGECELFWYVDDGLAKSLIWPLTILRDIGTTTEEPPEPYPTWIDSLTVLGAETLQNAQDAAQSASEAEQSATDAGEAKNAAEIAADRAEDALEEFTTPTASATTLAPESAATASYSNGHFTFGIPKGAKGDPGDPATNLVSSVNGKTGAVVLGAGDIGYDGETTYPDASVGKELGTINSALTSLQSVTEIIDTASGAIASFPDGSGLPMRSLVAEINPVQDLHGYDAPWPAGGGKNLIEPYDNNLPYSNAGATVAKDGDGYKVVASGVTGYPYVRVGTIHGLKAGTYSFSKGFPSGIGLRVIDRSVTPANTYNSVNPFTVSEDTANDIHVEMTFDGSLVADGTYTGILFQVELGSTATSFAPYSNICPITGWTGLQGQRTGVNVFDQSNVLDFYVGGVGGTTVGVGGTLIAMPVKKGVTYTINGTIGNRSGLYYTYLSPSEISYGVVLEPNPGYQFLAAFPFTFTAHDTCTLCFYVNTDWDQTIADSIYAVVGSSAETYTPYTGEAISVTFPSTVYGGSDEVIDGNGTESFIMIDLSALPWRYRGEIGTGIFSAVVSDNYSRTPIQAPLSNTYKFIGFIGSVAYMTEDNSFGLYSETSNKVLYVKDERFTSVSAFAETFSSLQIGYELSTPQTFAHTGQEVDTLVGQNNVWVTSGDVEVTYQASIKGYIDKVLGQ